MNKTDLIAEIAKRADLTKAEAKEALDAFIEVTTEVLKNDERLTLTGFGTFYAVIRDEREGINPQTKQKITVAAKKVAKFKGGAVLNDSIQ